MLHLLTVNTHHYGYLHFLHHGKHLSIRFNHFNRPLWVAVRCEASRMSEAMPAVAVASEASEDTCIYIYMYETGQPALIQFKTGS